MDPRVSIITPVYNGAELLPRTLESALAQTWENLEIIVIDDGSKDDSLQVARNYECSRLRVISQKNSGQCASENRGIRESTGDFFVFLDADDLMARDKVERQVKLLGSPDCGYVSTCEWGRFFDDPEEARFEPNKLWQDLDPVDWLVYAWRDLNMMHGATWLIPRAVLDGAGHWDERLTLINDHDFFCRVLLASKGAKFCHGARTYYRWVKGSLSGLKSEKGWASALQAMRLAEENLLRAEDSKRTRDACATKYQQFIYLAYPEVPHLVVEAEDRLRELGGTPHIQPPGGPSFKVLASLLGWKAARRLQKTAYRHGYERLAVGWKLRRLMTSARSESPGGKGS